MPRRISISVRLIRRLLSGVAGLLVLVIVSACVLVAQATSSVNSRWDGHVAWVLPFENNSAQPGLDWIGASFPDLMNQRLTSAGFLTIRREDRRYALKHLGLPAEFHPTHATTYRIGKTLDADFIVFGTYKVADGRITATARVLDMHGPRMGSVLQEQGDLGQLIHVENALAWKAAVQMEPQSNLQEQTFLAASKDLRLDSFEDYIRGEIDSSEQDKISHLTKAVQLSPNYSQAWLALGKAYFADQQYEQAIGPLEKVPAQSRLSLEAKFYSGLSYLYTGNYPKAQAEFSYIAAVLPMSEVLNNEGVSINRRGQNGTALFERVVQLNPQNADYWFNLAVSERRVKNYSAALKAVSQYLALKPQDEEAQGLRQNLQMLKNAPPSAKLKIASTMQRQEAPAMDAASDETGSGSATTDEASWPGTAGKKTANSSSNPSSDASAESAEYDPLERIARSYDESAFRQAAFALEQMNALKLKALPASKRAVLLGEQGQSYVNEGLLLEAEREFQLALAADPKSAAAYAGLAEVHEYSGSARIAQQEAAESLQMYPNVQAYLVLARIDLAQRSLDSAQSYVQRALQLDPKNSAALGIEQAIRNQQSK